MTDIPPPEEPGWYADASGAWWWWDGRGWTPQAPPATWGAGSAPDPIAAGRAQEKTMALVMWIVYLVGGGFIAALVFFFTSKQKPFVRHHSAEALNLSILLGVLQIVAFVLVVPSYLDLLTATDPDTVTLPATFFVGLVLLGLATVGSYAFSITGLVKASRGSWIPLPIGIHPVRGVVRKGEPAPFSVT